LRKEVVTGCRRGIRVAHLNFVHCDRQSRWFCPCANCKSQPETQSLTYTKQQAHTPQRTPDRSSNNGLSGALSSRIEQGWHNKRQSMQPSTVQRHHQGVLAVLLSPAVLALTQAHTLALQAVLLPKRLLVTCLYVCNTGSGDLLAYLTAQPTSKMQVRRVGYTRCSKPAAKTRCRLVANAAADRCAGPARCRCTSSTPFTRAAHRPHPPVPALCVYH